jgi:cell division protein FtsI (penicillin-binding protein 3)
MYRDAKPINWVAVRIASIAVLFALGTVFLIVRSYRLGVTDAETLQKVAEKQRKMVLSLETRRGMIVDRSGEPMAASMEVTSVYVRPPKVVDKPRTAKILAEALEMDEKEIAEKLNNEKKPFVWLARRVSPLVAARIAKADLPGVDTVQEYQRFYPLRKLAAHAVGFAGLDSRGLEGLELYYDEDLKADPIPVTAQRDALGRPVMFAAIGQVPKRRDLRLTMDRNIQFVAERELEEAVRREGAKNGMALVTDADSGEILAMAVAPSYNLNVFQKTSADLRRNRAVSDTFEPGSTFKVFLAAAAIDLGRVDLTEQFNCYKGLFKYKGAEIHDVVPHKSLSFEDVIVHSSNIGAVQVSEKLKKTEFFRYIQSFGFGSPTGVDLPGERPGSLALPGKWSVLSKANIAFGQGISVNAVQMNAAFAAAVNGGSLYVPHLMKCMTNALGETIREHSVTPVRRVIKESTSQTLVNILRQVVQEGTGKSASINGVDIIGKTGTAQKADSAGGYSRDKYVASFIGAIMSTKPRYVILVVIDEPAGKFKTGGRVAVPTFRKIAAGILALCGSRPHEGELILASSDTNLSRSGFVPSKAAKVRKGPRPGEWIVPNLKGLDMRQVLDACGTMKCDPSFKGLGTAVDQKPKAGRVIKEGDPLEVSFEGQAS